jgi:hypothetical protein
MVGAELPMPKVLARLAALLLARKSAISGERGTTAKGGTDCWAAETMVTVRGPAEGRQPARTGRRAKRNRIRMKTVMSCPGGWLK